MRGTHSLIRPGLRSFEILNVSKEGKPSIDLELRFPIRHINYLKNYGSGYLINSWGAKCIAESPGRIILTGPLVSLILLPDKASKDGGLTSNKYNLEEGYYLPIIWLGKDSSSNYFVVFPVSTSNFGYKLNSDPSMSEEITKFDRSGQSEAILSLGDSDWLIASSGYNYYRHLFDHTTGKLLASIDKETKYNETAYASIPHTQTVFITSKYNDLGDNPKHHKIVRVYLVGDERSQIYLWCTVSSRLLNSIIAPGRGPSFEKNKQVQGIVLIPEVHYFIGVLRAPTLIFCDYSDAQNSWKVRTLYLQGISQVRTNQLAWTQGSKLMASSYSKDIHYIQISGLSCHPTCRTCSLFIDDTGCTSCKEGSYYDKGTCRKCHKSCSSCKLVKERLKCLKCSAVKNRTQIIIEDRCHRCPSHCLTCKDPLICLKCSDGFVSQEKKCISPKEEVKIQELFYEIKELREHPPGRVKRFEIHINSDYIRTLDPQNLFHIQFERTYANNSTINPSSQNGTRNRSLSGDNLTQMNLYDPHIRNRSNKSKSKLINPEKETRERSHANYDKLGRLILSIQILEMDSGQYILRVIPKITKPKLPVKHLSTTIYSTKQLRTKIIQSAKAGRVIQSQSTDVQDTMFVLSMVQSIFDFMGSFSSALKVGLTIKMVKVLKLINVKFGHIVDAFFQEFTRTVVEKERDDMAVLARKFNGKLTEMGVQISLLSTSWKDIILYTIFKMLNMLINFLLRFCKEPHFAFYALLFRVKKLRITFMLGLAMKVALYGTRNSQQVDFFSVMSGLKMDVLSYFLSYGLIIILTAELSIISFRFFELRITDRLIRLHNMTFITSKIDPIIEKKRSEVKNIEVHLIVDHSATKINIDLHYELVVLFYDNIAPLTKQADHLLVKIYLMSGIFRFLFYQIILVTLQNLPVVQIGMISLLEVSISRSLFIIRIVLIHHRYFLLHLASIAYGRLDSSGSF